MDELSEELSREFFGKFIRDMHFLLTYELHFLVKVIREAYPELLSEEMLAHFDNLPYFLHHPVKESHGMFFVKNRYIEVREDDTGEIHFEMDKALAVYVVEDLKDLIDESVENDVLLYFLTALSNLYGCFSVQQFLRVWDRYNRRPLSGEKVIRICQHFNRQKYPFRYEQDYIVHEILRTVELEEMLELVAEKPYYCPTADEISLYTSGIIDKTAEAYIRMADYLHNHPGGLNPENLEGLIENIGYALKYNSSYANIRKILELMAYRFEDDRVEQVFSEIIRYSTVNTRKWINRGFMDVEVE
ncbi:MAG TPA: hypothetical protein PK466_11045 [Thermotogota bacterium]|nr:hypothetical protein [Thermotogota bacterium]HPJ89924.1 hypothetical protein [Thermotogota bacterium]HPR96862.1 hypothetical protein [Thermotogota bacterium]